MRFNQTGRVFVYEWDLLWKLCGVSKTLKVHVTEHHIGDYLKITGKPLGRRTDQTTEASHQYMNTSIVKSNYLVKDMESHMHGLKLNRCVLHLNAYTIEINMVKNNNYSCWYEIILNVTKSPRIPSIFSYILACAKFTEN